MPITKKAKAIVIALVGAGLLVIPWVSSLGILNAAIKALIAALFALAFNLLMGQAGLLSFGQAAFFGIGGFATIHLMKSTAHGLAVPIVLLPVAGGLAGLVLGLGSGWFATKRTGAYFAMITLAVAELLYAISLRWTGVFGGEAGISSMRMPWVGFTFGSAGEVYYLVMVWVLGCSFLLYLYNQTPFGRLTLAIRDNENRIRFLGYDTHKTKVVIFGISAMFSGIAGSLLAIAEESVSFAVFDANVSAMVVLQTFIGGCNTFLGPAVGTAVLTFFAQEISDISRSWLLYEGVIFVLVMMFMPNGIGGMFGELYRMVQGKNRKTPKPGPSLRHFLRVTFATAVVFSAIIFSVEACGILFSEKYSAMRRAAGNHWVGFDLFGARWNPNAPWLWVTPALLFAIGLFLLPHVGATLRGKIKKFR
jgi:branched-chain amino acid transport system permease protein